MPLRLFRSRDVTGSNLVMALLVVGMFGLFFLGALYLQRILGYSPLKVGLAFLPSTRRDGRRVAAPLRPLSCARRSGARARAGDHVAGLLLFARTPVDGTYLVDVLPATLLIGLGTGLSMPALMTLAMSGATPRTPAWPPAWSTRPCRSAARSASPCWRRWPPSARAARPAPEALLLRLPPGVPDRRRRRWARRRWSRASCACSARSAVAAVLRVVTWSPHVASDPSSAISCIARWVMKFAGSAPCQWSSLASKCTVSPARIGSTGAARGLDEPGALGHVERLAERVRVPGGAGAGREVHAQQLDVRAGRDRVDPDLAGEPLGRAAHGSRAGGGRMTSMAPDRRR